MCAARTKCQLLVRTLCVSKSWCQLLESEGGCGCPWPVVSCERGWSPEDSYWRKWRWLPSNSGVRMVGIPKKTDNGVTGVAEDHSAGSCSRSWGHSPCVGCWQLGLQAFHLTQSWSALAFARKTQAEPASKQESLRLGHRYQVGRGFRWSKIVEWVCKCSQQQGGSAGE